VRQSNSYIIIYSAILTVVCGGLLALASEGLKEKQQANIDQEQKKNILSTVMALTDTDDVNAIYDKRVNAYVVDFNGKKVDGVNPAKLALKPEYKKKPQDRMLPVYEFKSEADPNKIEFVVLPVFGYGLWNDISGFVALKSDLTTVQGVSFSHVGETPGLGARIAESDIQDRFKGKSIFDGDVIASITMMKGEGKDYSSDAHKVDGMSGATLTGKGLNNMLADYFKSYENYLKSKRNPQ
jgi:Na+-transporting NADH:ubiquinone oxidoreductase subunit C